MSIDYTSSAAYGVVISDEYRERVIDLAVELGYDLGEYGRDDIDYWDAVELVAEKFNLKCFTAGDSYSGETEHLIGEGVTNWQFGWTKIEPPSPTLSDTAVLKLQRLRLALDMHEEPAWYAGLHVW